MAQQHGRSMAMPAYLEGEGPLLDVRSPGEFSQGHIPGAINLPLFSDEERAAVGTAYKQQDRQTAVLLGLETIGPRLEQLAQALISHSGGSGRLRLYCWRGGMRSASMAWLAGTVDLDCQLLAGGYKAYRRWVLSQFERPWPLIVLGGRTGGGKTDLLLALKARGVAVLDLEGLAHHRGSSFGGLGLPAQPSSEHFENRIADSLWRCPEGEPIWLEAESAQVGRCRLPAALWQQMQQAVVVELQRPTRERVQRLVAVYGAQPREQLRSATERIARRLGPQRTALALAAIETGDMATACEQMLEYYDRCYDHELAQRPRSPQLRLNGDGCSEAELAEQLCQWQRDLGAEHAAVPLA
jgi:tRNA 2-selenouridine synthase